VIGRASQHGRAAEPLVPPMRKPNCAPSGQRDEDQCRDSLYFVYFEYARAGEGRRMNRDERDGAGPPGARALAPPADVTAAVESLLFVAEEPVELSALARALNVPAEEVEQAVERLTKCCRERGIRVQRAGGKIQLITAPELGPYVERFLGAENEQKLSVSALETLAIIAYRQPVARPAIEAIRGVNCERAVATLRARGLVEEVGRAETVGHPVLFGTTIRFLEYFGLEHPGELPPLPELQHPEGGATDGASAREHRGPAGRPGQER